MEAGSGSRLAAVVMFTETRGQGPYYEYGVLVQGRATEGEALTVRCEQENLAATCTTPALYVSRVEAEGRLWWG